ncbi:hypothetical protein ACOMHN_041098 [Nucella lapillus]
MSEKHNSLLTELDYLKRKIEQLEGKNAKLEQENHSIKTQMGTMQSQLKKINSRCVETTFTQTSPLTPQEMSPVFPLEQTPSQMEQKTSLFTGRPESPVSESLTVSSQTMDSVKVTEAHSSPTEENAILFGEKFESPVSESLTLSSQTRDMIKVTEAPFSEANECEIQEPKQEYSIPVANSFAVLSSLDSGPNLKQHQRTQPAADKHQDEVWYQAASDRETFSRAPVPKPSPQETLSKITIPNTATMLLIGDLVISNIDPYRLAPKGENMFKICVSGMKVADLLTWLHSLPAMTNINGTIVHIGVNSCQSGAVTEKEWVDIIKQCLTAFPRSSLNMSTIIPARGRHHFNNAIFPSNRNLRAACLHQNVTFIDNTSTFSTSSGAPRLALYLNITHPSDRGTSRLANNFQSICLRSTTCQAPSLRLPTCGLQPAIIHVSGPQPATSNPRSPTRDPICKFTVL